jgi:DNA-binding transcriptional regulator GbsR (MarR family)
MTPDSLSPTASERANEADWRRRFVEDMGGLTLLAGLPRAVMRVLAWMIVCEPRDQTARDIQRDLNLSAGSVSAAVRGLCDVGMIERVAQPGDRRIHYRISSQGWESALEARFRVLTELRRVAERAVDAADGEDDERLHEMRDTFALMEEGVQRIMRAGPSRSHTRELPTGTTPFRRDH